MQAAGTSQSGSAPTGDGQRAISFPSNSQNGSQQGSEQGQQAGSQGQSGASQSSSGNGSNPAQQGSGSEARFPGEQDGVGQGRDGSTGDLGSGRENGQSGGSSSGTGVLGSPSGDYSLDTLPEGVLSGNSSGSTQGAMTNAERIRVLDERLEKGYETFDGFILSERERAQNESNAAGSSAPPGGGAGGAAGSAQGQPQILPTDSGTQPSPAVVSQPSNPGRNSEETFPPPDDIPSGRDDDVVARQIRELAMSEPDPELREAIWEEYRKYTGIGEEQ